MGRIRNVVIEVLDTLDFLGSAALHVALFSPIAVVLLALVKN